MSHSEGFGLAVCARTVLSAVHEITRTHACTNTYDKPEYEQMIRSGESRTGWV